MKLTGTTLLKIFLPLVLFTTSTVSAYDIDTHFYLTYAMARFVGIKHEVAARIALGGEWGDEHLITTPMLGLKMRKPHFPGYVKASKISAYQAFGIDDVTKTKQLHDFATEMFTEGLKEGNLFKAIQSFHTMQDSFSHHGTPQSLGHSWGGHWPDRPYWRNFDWYKAMVKANIEMLWAIRELLPEEALDKDLHPAAGSSKRNFEMASAELAEAFTSHPMVRTIANRNILTEPEYVEFAVRNLMAIGIADNYFFPNQNIAKWLNTHDYRPGEDARASLERLILRMAQWEVDEYKKNLAPGEREEPSKCLWKNQVINRKFISQDVGIYLCDPIWMRQHGGSQMVAREMIDVLTQGHVPNAPSPYGSLIEVELEGPIREKEMEMRVRQSRYLIWNLYGLNVEFKPNQDNYKQVRSILTREDPPASENFGVVNYNATQGVVEISMTDTDQSRYAQLIKSYLFPHLSAKPTWRQHLATIAGYSAGPISLAVYWPLKLRQLMGEVQYDLLENRIVAGPQNTYYRDLPTFQEYRGKVFKYLLKPQTVREMGINSGADRRVGGLLYDGSAARATILP